MVRGRCDENDEDNDRGKQSEEDSRTRLPLGWAIYNGGRYAAKSDV